MYGEDNSAALLDELQPEIEADYERPRDFFEEAYAPWSDMIDYINFYGLPILDAPGAPGDLLKYIQRHIVPDE